MESEIGKEKRRERLKRKRKIGRGRLLKKVPVSLCCGFIVKLK